MTTDKVDAALDQVAIALSQARREVDCIRMRSGRALRIRHVGRAEATLLRAMEGLNIAYTSLTEGDDT